MTTLAANTPRPARRERESMTWPVEASTHIYEGSLVMINAAGNAVPAAAVASNQGCVGVADEEANNTGAAGAKRVRVRQGEFLITGLSLALTVNSARVYAQDDNSVDETQGSNQPQAGLVTEYLTSTSAWVAMGLVEGKV